MKTLVRTLLALAVTTSFAGVAMAENSNCTSKPQSQWMTMDAVKANASSMGYKVRSIRREGSCYEAKALINGERREVVINPVSGEIVDGNEQN